MSEEYTLVGRVRSANPARREVRIDALKGRANDFEGLTWLHVRLRDGEVLRSRTASVRVRENGIIVMLAPGVTRDNVGAMKRCDVLFPASETRPLAWHEMDAKAFDGLEVFDRNGSRVGEVAAGLETKAHVVLEVVRQDGSSVLLPLIPEVVDTVDWDKKRLIVHEIGPYTMESDDGSRLT